MAAIKHSLEVALGALRHAVEGHPGAAALHLGELSPLVLPLLTSPIVGRYHMVNQHIHESPWSRLPYLGVSLAAAWQGWGFWATCSAIASFVKHVVRSSTQKHQAADHTTTHTLYLTLNPPAASLPALLPAGDAAFTAVRALARCMPPPLNATSLLLAGCLRLVVLAGQPGSPVSYDNIPSQSAVAGVMAALVASTVTPRRPMPGPSYALVFPVLKAVLHCPHHTPLHDDALAVLALHVRPEQDIPRAASLELLYHLLGIIPAARWVWSMRGRGGGDWERGHHPTSQCTIENKVCIAWWLHIVPS